MSLAEIEAELEKLGADDLRSLAIKSWSAFLQKEGRLLEAHECSEDDPSLLAALDQAIAQADKTPEQGSSADEVRAELNKWISK